MSEARKSVIIAYEGQSSYKRLLQVAEEHGMSVEEYAKYVIDSSTANYMKEKQNEPG